MFQLNASNNSVELSNQVIFARLDRKARHRQSIKFHLPTHVEIEHATRIKTRRRLYQTFFGCENLVLYLVSYLDLQSTSRLLRCNHYYSRICKTRYYWDHYPNLVEISDILFNIVDQRVNHQSSIHLTSIPGILSKIRRAYKFGRPIRKVTLEDYEKIPLELKSGCFYIPTNFHGSGGLFSMVTNHSGSLLEYVDFLEGRTENLCRFSCSSGYNHICQCQKCLRTWFRTPQNWQCQCEKKHYHKCGLALVLGYRCKCRGKTILIIRDRFRKHQRKLVQKPIPQMNRYNKNYR
jgi:hypothetical protein